MKTLIVTFSVLITIFSCSSTRVMQSYRYNYYIIDNLTPKIYSENSYVVDNYILVKINKATYIYDTDFFKKEIILVSNKDTMRIYGFFDNHNNYYFKGLNFKRGDYFLVDYTTNIKKPTEIYGRDLNLSGKNSRIFFEDYNTSHKSGNPKKNKQLKELKFILINFSDTTNYKFQLITKEKFWDNYFSPTINNE